MSKNRILRIMLVISTMVQLIIIMYLGVLIVGLVYWHIDRNFFADFPIPILGERAFIKFTKVTSSSIGTLLTVSPATLNNISPVSLYLIFGQLVGIGILSLIALREFTSVMRSVKKNQTFAVKNIKSFKKIALYMAYVSILVSFQYSAYKESVLSGIYVQQIPLLICILAAAMSEIFKEGNGLLEYSRERIKYDESSKSHS